MSRSKRVPVPSIAAARAVTSALQDLNTEDRAVVFYAALTACGFRISAAAVAEEVLRRRGEQPEKTN